MNDSETKTETTWLSARTLADWFVVDTKTVRNWEAAGILPPAHRLGARCTRWDSNDIEAFIDGHFQPWQDQPMNSRYHPSDVANRIRRGRAAEEAAEQRRQEATGNEASGGLD